MINRVFVTDWDETATVQDTTTLIANAAYHASNMNVPPFRYFSKIYMNTYNSYIDDTGNGCGTRDSLEAEISFQKGMESVELSSIRALEETGYFRGFSKETFLDLTSAIKLRRGFVDFVKNANCPVYVLSINWCATLIKSVLSAHGIPNVKVLANDFEYGSNKLTTGIFDPNLRILTGYDKAVELEKIRATHPGSHVYYFGDSSGDVLPILQADSGGIIRGGRGREALEKLSSVYNLQDQFLLSSSISLKIFDATWPDLLAVWTK